MEAMGYGGYDYSTLESLIREAEVVSFDLFDTLITRVSACPDAVQHYIGYLLSLQDPALTGFFERRKAAEDAARKQHPHFGDVDLDMIYAEFPGDDRWAPGTIASAHRLEEDIEIQFCIPRAGVVRLANYARNNNKRVIVVSDTYFSRAFIERLLTTLNLNALVDEIYLSSEQKARKDSGELWKLIRSKEGLLEKNFLHFGDNLHSDSAVPRTQGLRCIHVVSPARMLAARGLGFQTNQDWRSDLLFGPLHARIGDLPSAPSIGPDIATITDATALGYMIYGPILLAFFAWLTENPALQRVNRLYFTSREGYFLEKLYQRLRDQFAWKDLPPGQYLPMSRRAVNTATQALGLDPWRVIDGGGFHGSVEAFIKARLGLELSWPSKFVSPVSLPQDREYMAKILTILGPQILASAETECDALRKYCEQAGITRGDEIGIVDAGYSGTIQDGLQRILARPLLGFYMLTSPGVAKVQAGGGLAFGCFQDALNGDLRPDGFMRKTLLLEALLTAPHGQLARFEIDAGGEIHPVYLESGVSQEKFGCLEKIFEGALQYCVDSIKSGGRAVLHAIVPVRLNAFLCLDALICGEVRVTREIASCLYLEDNFTGNGEIACLGEVS